MPLLRTVLTMPGVPGHEATLDVPESSVGRWRRLFRALRQGGIANAQHSLGWHVYSQALGGGAYQLGVRWSNGLVRRSGSGFVGRIFFDALSLEVDGSEGLILVPEQRSGLFFNATTGQAFVAHGGGHYFPPRGVLERRFLLVPQAASAADITRWRDLAFGFKAVRIPPSGTKPWGPARERQPSVDRAHYSALFRQGAAEGRALLASGQPGSVRLGPQGTWAQLDLMVGALGPWIPDGDNQPGAPAGREIEMAVGWQQVPESLELSAMAHECSMARNPVAWNDLDTGAQLGCHDWLSSEIGRPVTTGQGLIMPMFLNAAHTDYPTFNAGSSPYQATLDGYKREDSEHVIRADDDAKGLAFAAGDPMASDDLAMLFEDHRAMVFNDRSDALPTIAAQQQAGWTKGLDGQPLTLNSPHGSVSWVGYQSLTRDSIVISTTPHKGTARALRQWGWVHDLGVANADGAFARKMLETHINAVDSCGVSFREYHTPFLPSGVQGAQMFHEMIDKAAALRAARMLGDLALMDRLLETVRLWARKVLMNRDCVDAKWVYRERADHTEIDPITAADHGPERMSEHILCVLGLAALCELDLGDTYAARELLQAGLTIDVPHSTLAERLAWLKAKQYDLSQYASYQAALEALEAA
jgi:hypothetical protein